jgi:hypothetical protein
VYKIVLNIIIRKERQFLNHTNGEIETEENFTIIYGKQTFKTV